MTSFWKEVINRNGKNKKNILDKPERQSDKDGTLNRHLKLIN